MRKRKKEYTSKVKQMHTLLLPKMTVKGYFKKGLYLQGQNERGRNSKFMEA